MYMYVCVCVCVCIISLAVQSWQIGALFLVGMCIAFSFWLVIQVCMYVCKYMYVCMYVHVCMYVCMYDWIGCCTEAGSGAVPCSPVHNGHDDVVRDGAAAGAGAVQGERPLGVGLHMGL